MSRASDSESGGVEVTLGLDEPDDDEALRRRAADALGRDPGPVEATRRSLDARRGRVRWRLWLQPQRPRTLDTSRLPRDVSGRALVVVVGTGPAGLFCAYELARRGIRCVLLDRGKPVQPRRHDLRAMNVEGAVDDDSNYCFGEGGAGTYSDGKLYTRATKRGDVRDVIETLLLHGAPRSIAIDARPHVGSNRLPKVITALRERLESVGVEFRFGARVEGLLVDGTATGHRAVGVRLATGTELTADAVVLATGHSARDVHLLAERAGATLVPKAFAMGVRIEHPQPFIDRAQYGHSAGHPSLPSASYHVAETVEGRGVYSFCMCPGGFTVPAATTAGELVVNGMSLSKRDSPHASSGLVVAVELDDLRAAGLGDATGGVRLQQALERAAWDAGGGALRAPATRAPDFLAGRASSSLPATSYLPGLTASDVGAVLDAGAVPFASRLRAALAVFERRMPGFAGNDAVLIGVESRTSSPVRIVRDPERLEAHGVAGLYPAGEGAGHAGGIVSAALDGIRVARSIAAEFGR